METILNVKRRDLKAKLEARIAELDEEYQGSELHGLRKALELAEKGESPDEYRTRMVEYYQKLAEGLEDGSITITDSGRLGGKPPTKPKLGQIPNDYYDGYYRYRYDWSKYSLENLKAELARRDRDHEANLRPLKSAIELLDISNDAYVPINTADYHKLLGSR